MPPHGGPRHRILHLESTCFPDFAHVSHVPCLLWFHVVRPSYLSSSDTLLVERKHRSQDDQRQLARLPLWSDVGAAQASVCPAPMSRVNGAWTAGSAGGCPKYKSWNTNPQFHLQPSVDGATYALELQQSAHPYHPIGFWVMTATDAASRKTTLVKSEMVTKTKYKAADRVSHSVQLPRRPEGLPYIVVVSTFDPEQLASFTLSVSSAEDPTIRLVPIMDASVPIAPAAVPAAALSPIGGARPAAAAAAPAPPAAPTRATSAVTQPPPQPAVPASQPVVTVTTPSADAKPVDNEPVITQEGQGLSEKQKADAAAMVQAALAQCAQTGRPYEDPDFGGAAALGDASWPHARLVTQWRRPSEIAATAGSPEAARLFKSDWEIEGVVLGPCANNWVMAAFNIVAGDPDVIGRVFVDREHAAQGFYALRFWHDDPLSDDDWRVVLVDDRLPCGADGLPCFAKNPSPFVFWASIVEKAVAKLFGSYQHTEAPISAGMHLRGLELVTGGSGKEGIGVQGADGEALFGAVQVTIPLRAPVSTPLTPRAATPRLARALLAARPGAKSRSARASPAVVPRPPQPHPFPPRSLPLFVAAQNAFATAHVVGARVDASAPEAAAAQQMGLVPDRAYCVVTAGEMMPPAGRLMRLRGFFADPEWRGKWSDGDGAWNNQLRQMLNYRDSSDGTFWIAFDDFARHFSELYIVRAHRRKGRRRRATSGRHRPVRLHLDVRMCGAALPMPSLFVSTGPGRRGLGEPPKATTLSLADRAAL